MNAAQAFHLIKRSIKKSGSREGKEGSLVKRVMKFHGLFRWVNLPSGKGARWRLVGGLGLLVILLTQYRVDRLLRFYFYDKREGDILFQSLPMGDLVESIEGVTQAPWSHCGVLIQENGRWYVAEAIIDVRKTPLFSWALRGRDLRFAAYRMKDTLSPGDRSKLKAALDGYMGRPYDLRYHPDELFIYCSELVYKAFRKGLDISLGEWQSLGSLNWEPHEAFIRSMENGELPLEREMITPVQVTRSEQLEQVFP